MKKTFMLLQQLKNGIWASCGDSNDEKVITDNFKSACLEMPDKKFRIALVLDTNE